jgi:hypothetical protein
MSNKLLPCIDWQKAWEHANDEGIVRLTYTVASNTKSPFILTLTDNNLGIISQVRGAFYNGHSFSAMTILEQDLKKLYKPPTEVVFEVKNCDKLQEARMFDIDLHIVMVELIVP